MKEWSNPVRYAIARLFCRESAGTNRAAAERESEVKLLNAKVGSYDSKMKKVLSAIDNLEQSLSDLRKACEALL